MTDAVPCSLIAREGGEDILGTASTVRKWLLVEQPGPWGRDALAESRVPAPVAVELAARARLHRVRILLLRRVTGRKGDHHACFAAHSGPRDPWMEHRLVPHPADLLDLDFAALGQGRRPGFGTPWERPLYLVCTHGRHDPCCAQFGRPVVRSLRRWLGDRLWECSHLGGDRFAGNLVCLPRGDYFGLLGPEEAGRVVRSYDAGTIELDHYRGRSCHPMAVQAAEVFARRSKGLVGVDDLAVVGRRRLSPTMVEVSLLGRDGRHLEVTVLVRASERARPLTCKALGPSRPPTYSLVSLRA